MTSQPASDGIFESYRRAEMLIADRRPLDALQALGPVLESQPDDVSVQLLAGRAYLNSAQLQRAEQAFARVVEQDPADHYARFGLGKALHRQGRWDEAHAQLKMAAAMDPRPEYQEALGETRARMATRAARAGSDATGTANGNGTPDGDTPDGGTPDHLHGSDDLGDPDESR